jgi:hypothetical protein
MTEQDVVTAMIENRVKLAGPLSVSAGISSGQFSGVGMSQSVRSLTVPLGLHLDGKSAALAALYRYQTNSARNRGGHGGRISGRVNGGAFRASAFVDAQQEAATVALVLREEPVLAQLLEELGLTASSSEDLARLLRDNVTLAQLGYTSGAQLDFNPWRAQAGADVAWVTQDKSRQQLRLRVLASQTQTVTTQKETLSASLAYSRRLGAGVDATAMLSWWSHDGEMTPQPDLWSIAAGLRVRLDRTSRRARPTSPTTDARAVTSGRLIGTVRDDAGTPMPGIVFALSGRGTRQTVTSDSSGHFRVDAAPGDYELVAHTDSVPAGYDPNDLGVPAIHLETNAPLTTELVVRAQRSVSGTVHARVAASALRIVELDRAGTLDSSGRFVFRGLPPGTFTIEVVIDGGIEHRPVVVPASPAAIRVGTIGAP